MPTVKLRDDQWGKAWRILIGIGPIHRLPEDGKVYLVSDDHIEALLRNNIPFEQIYSHKEDLKVLRG